jgi:hypothetical protein
MEKELDYINYCIVENECHIKRLDTTGYPVEIQKQYSDYLFKKREILSTIKQALTTKSKKEQAFDIIKEREVDVNLLNIRHSAETYNDDYYKIHYSYNVAGYLLTEEEFDLLKEVLNDNSQE